MAAMKAAEAAAVHPVPVAHAPSNPLAPGMTHHWMLVDLSKMGTGVPGAIKHLMMLV